jgi:hypothetical protein
VNWLAGIGLLLPLALTGCASDDAADAGPSTSGSDIASTSPSTTPSGAAAAGKVFPGGEPLASYEGDPTHDWRVKLTDQQDYVRRELEELGGDPALVTLDDSAFERIVTICSGLASTRSNAELVREVQQDWSALPDDLISPDTAGKLFLLSVHWACPSLGTRPAGAS